MRRLSWLSAILLPLASCAVGNVEDGPIAGKAGAAGGSGASAGTAPTAGTGGAAGNASSGSAGNASGMAGNAGVAGQAGFGGQMSGAGGALAGSAGAGAGAGASGAAGMESGGSAGSTLAGAAGVAGESGQAGAGQAGTTGTGGATQAGGSGASGAGGFVTCATGSALAQAKVRPVDIVFVVDNSASMQPAVTEVNAGLANFAALVGQKMLDYKVIMLSLRGKGTVIANNATKYGVCVTPPLAGDDNCGNGPNFYQSSIDIRSTQPLEQLLGTLGQTKGYTAADGPQPNADKRGGDAWKDELRVDATKSFVVVSDDDSRLTASDFLNFVGGKNPNSMTSYDLPPGLLQPFWNGLFDKWVFHGIYGYGSDSDPGVKCAYPNGTFPPKSGAVYTTLVQQSKGARAKLCDGAAAWGPFFDDVAKAVADTSQIACDVTLPASPDGKAIDPAKVNVSFVTQGMETTLFQVDGPSGPTLCKPEGGWYYDNAANPTKVFLCPASCDAANAVVGAGKTGSISVTFGCNSVKP